jgi:serine/threonine-protein kinase
MSDPHLICPPVSGPTRDWRETWRRRHTLPPDLLREASVRLRVMSLLGAALWVVGAVAAHLALRAMARNDPRWARYHPTDSITALAVLVSLGLYVYARKPDRDPHFILDLGLVYMVFTSLAIGVVMHWEPMLPGIPIMPMVSWVGPLVLMFAAIVPATPGKTLVAGLIAASMMPVGMLIARERGVWDFGPMSNILLMHYPDYILVGVAVVISHVVIGLGQHVAKAREMGSYQLGELLGRGGMGEVYKATHRMLARPAAIKLIRPDMVAPGDHEAAELAIKRFRREAEVAARLRSPHTVALYDFGLTDDQTLYLVMELLEGMDTQTLVLQHGPIGASRAIHILRQVCDSLEEAHALGLVHRDIKPPNIHVGRVGLRHDFVKVLDFGLVKWVAGENIEQSLATASALTPGTPAYMPPEAALGGAVDARSDLYSVGCVAYFLLTGKLVFEADTALHVLAKHLQADPIPPSRRAPVRIPPALDRLVMACLEKSPDKRPRDAAELSRALAAIDVEPWTEAQAKQWWSAHLEETQAVAAP